MADNYSAYYNQVGYNYGTPASNGTSTAATLPYGVDPQSISTSQYGYQASYADQYGVNAQQYQQMPPYQPSQQYQQPQTYQSIPSYQPAEQYQQQQQAQQPYGYMDSSMYSQGNQDYYNYSIQQMAYQQLQQSYEAQSNKKDDTVSNLQSLADGSSKKQDDDDDGPVFGVELSKQAPEDQQNHIQQQMQQQMKQAFEKQIHQQIHQMVLQKLGQPSGNSEGRTVFGEDNVGVRSGASTEVVGGVGSDGKSKYYCSTCDINYANSLAFTSHLGSREHKMQKERLDKDPGYREDFMARVAQKQQQQLMQQQQQTAVRNVPGKKQFHCRLCSTNINGAELYAVHLKSFEHQQMLKMSRETKEKMAMFARPSQASFGVDLNAPKMQPFLEPSKDGLGLEFIEELRDETGQVMRVFCNLCKFDIENEEMKMLHLNGQKHSTLYKERMEKYQGGFVPQQTPPGNPQMQQIIQQQLEQQLQQTLPQLNLPAGQQDAFVQQVNMQVHSMLQQTPFMKHYEEKSTAPFPPMSQYPPNGPPPFPSDYPPPPPNSFNRPTTHFGMSPPPSHYQPDPFLDQPQFGISLHMAGMKPFGTPLGRSSKSFQHEADDDNDLLVKEKHTLVYPTSKQFNAVRKVLGDAEKWLKQMQPQQDVSIKHIKRINTVAKGLLSTSDLDLDLLVLISDWPTHSFVEAAYQQLNKAIQEGDEKELYVISLQKDSLLLRLSEVDQDETIKKEEKGDGEKDEVEDEGGAVENEGDDEAGDDKKKVAEVKYITISCRIQFACDSLKEEATDDKEDLLSKQVVQSSLKQLHHTKWFQNNANKLPSCVMVLRVVKAVCRANQVLCNIQDQTMELLMAGVLSAYNSAARPGQAFKFFIEALCQGVLEGRGVVKAVEDSKKKKEEEGEEGKEGGGDGDKKDGSDEKASAETAVAKDARVAKNDARKEAVDGKKSKYEFVVNNDLMTSWWKVGRDDDNDDLLTAITDDIKFHVMQEAKKLLELIQAGDTHVILGLERRVKAHKASNDVAAQEFKKDDAAVAEEVKKMAEVVAGGAVGASGDKADEAEAPNSPRDEEESDGYTPSRKRQKFRIEKQANE